MQQPSGPQPPVMPPPTFAAPVAPSLYRQAWRIVRTNRRETMLPLLFTEFPVAIALAIATFVLYHEIYPDIQFGTVSEIAEDPAGLLLSLLVMNGVYWLFSLVGLAATAFAANGIIAGKPVGLAASLDPAFTRMGGLLGLGFTYYGFLIILAFGIIPVLFFIIRFGLALHAFIIDGQPLGQALRTSWSLLRRRMLKFTGMLLVLSAIAFGAMLAVVLVLSLITAPFIGTEPSRTDELVIISALIAGAGIAVVPLGAFMITTMTLYYLREKKESGIA